MLLTFGTFFLIIPACRLSVSAEDGRDNGAAEGRMRGNGTLDLLPAKSRTLEATGSGRWLERRLIVPASWFL